MHDQTVLIVDDSSVDLEIISMVSRALGCNVDVASGGFEAIEVYNPKRHDLVLCDYFMEPVNGIYVVSKILEKNAEAKCIMVSGYPDAQLRRFVEEQHLYDLIVKPIRADALRQCLRLAMHESEGASSPITGIALSHRMDTFPLLCGDCPDLQALRNQLASSIPIQDPLLLVGSEELSHSVSLELAKFVHQNGSCAGGACVIMSARDYSEEELHSYLINPAGDLGLQVKRAAQGSLILQHVECLPLSIQKLLADALDGIMIQTRVIFLTDHSVDESLVLGHLEDSFYFKIASNCIELPQNIAV
jgi:DNA-binding NtrC family response regulator